MRRLIVLWTSLPNGFSPLFPLKVKCVVQGTLSLEDSDTKLFEWEAEPLLDWVVLLKPG